LNQKLVFPKRKSLFTGENSTPSMKNRFILSNEELSTLNKNLENGAISPNNKKTLNKFLASTVSLKTYDFLPIKIQKQKLLLHEIRKNLSKKKKKDSLGHSKKRLIFAIETLLSKNFPTKENQRPFLKTFYNTLQKYSNDSYSKIESILKNTDVNPKRKPS
jgi:hypothetical protein